MRTLFLLYFFACALPAAFSQNSCYNDLLAAGNKHLNSGRYDKAIQQYEAAKLCGDKPANGDGVLKNKIATARQKKKEGTEEAADAQAAQNQLAEIAWRRVQSKPSPLQYKHFVEKFPRSKAAVEANQKIAAMQAKFKSGKCDFCPEMVLVKGGSFFVGDMEQHVKNDDTPAATRVNDFYIGKYEVTNELFCKFLNEEADIPSTKISGKGDILFLASGNKCTFPNKVIELTDSFVVKPGYEKHPFFSFHSPSSNNYGSNTTCYTEFAQWISVKTGLNYRIPSEVEWEYAARGGRESMGFRYAGGDEPNSVGWFPNYQGSNLHFAVGGKKPNELGLYDMSGNVSECVVAYTAEPNGKQTPTTFEFRGGGCGCNNIRDVYTRLGLSSWPKNGCLDDFFYVGFRLVYCPPGTKCGG